MILRRPFFELFAHLGKERNAGGAIERLRRRQLRHVGVARSDVIARLLGCWLPFGFGCHVEHADYVQYRPLAESALKENDSFVAIRVAGVPF